MSDNSLLRRTFAGKLSSMQGLAMPLPHIGSMLSRRDLLQLGALGVAASALPPVVSAAVNGKRRADSVIAIWLAGGMTHHESFDPKPDAPVEIRGSLKTIATKLPGVRFTEVMPRLAELTDQFALLRTYAAGSDDHLIAQSRQLSGRRTNAQQITTEPNIGAILAKLHGPRAGFPGYIAIPGTTRPGPPPYNLFVGGWIGEQYAPFPTGGKPKNEDFTAFVKEAAEEDFNQQSLRVFPGLDESRLADRRGLREAFDSHLAHLEAATADQYRGAFEMLLAPAVRRSLDLSREADKTRERYGKTKIGARCLLARRLVEAGAGFVMVDYGYDPEYGNLWDNHNAAGQNFPPIGEMAQRPYHLAGVDRAAAALLEDLATRGLLDRTLVLLLSEFGRTPKINKDAGRDHWGHCGSIFFAGGGSRGGQVIGTTDKNGAYPITPAYGPWDVAATIYEALGVDRQAVLTDREGRRVPLVPEGKPIPGVLG
ncbi:MAG TPA: DUF1501 domain-containing protein [Urbifossiella sp.]|nr:DUF1501 domain-containing protein [Urbifossiella sp.]